MEGREGQEAAQCEHGKPKNITSCAQMLQRVHGMLMSICIVVHVLQTVGSECLGHLRRNPPPIRMPFNACCVKHVIVHGRQLSIDREPAAHNKVLDKAVCCGQYSPTPSDSSPCATGLASSRGCRGTVQTACQSSIAAGRACLPCWRGLPTGESTIGRGGRAA
jgi:hypothetical protein